MAETIIVKKNAKGEDVYYHVEAEYVPSKISDICEEFIVAYCEANGEEAINWLVKTVNTKVPTQRTNKETGEKEKGEDIYMPFVSLRSAFAKKYFPNIIKGDKKAEGSSLRDRLNAKYGKK